MKDRKPDLETVKPEAEGMDPQINKKPRGQAALGRDIQAKIGQQLRAYYDSLVEPTPDRFADLLQQIEKSRGKDSPE